MLAPIEDGSKVAMLTGVAEPTVAKVLWHHNGGVCKECGSYVYRCETGDGMLFDACGSLLLRQH